MAYFHYISAFSLLRKPLNICTLLKVMLTLALFLNSQSCPTNLKAADLCVLSLLLQGGVDPVQDKLIRNFLSAAQIRKNHNGVPEEEQTGKITEMLREQLHGPPTHQLKKAALSGASTFSSAARPQPGCVYDSPRLGFLLRFRPERT